MSIEYYMYYVPLNTTLLYYLSDINNNIIYFIKNLFSRDALYYSKSNINNIKLLK